MTKKEKDIIWQLMRGSASVNIVAALVRANDESENQTLESFFAARDFNFDEALGAVRALFDSVKPTE